MTRSPFDAIASSPQYLPLILFGLAAWFVEGFRLKWGVWSAILGTILLAFLNSILGHVFTLIPGIS